ncbi:uncharacterized protein L199_004929 [Kwoniella botswanensis]|uniref:uncharacterized protein n=1 Tax=Kwoniella botswanensis TaxID=1268659 RepID=UPI00315CC757
MTPVLVFHYAYNEVVKPELEPIHTPPKDVLEPTEKAFQTYLEDSSSAPRLSDGAPVRTLEEWCDAGLQFPQQRQICWLYRAGKWVPGGMRQYGFDTINGLTEEFKLTTPAREKTLINDVCLLALHRQILSIDLKNSHRDRISLLTLFAIATSNAMDFSTILRPRVSYKVMDNAQGPDVVKYLVYGCFRIWVRKGMEGGCNQLYAWIGPRGVVPGQGNVWPLTPGSPQICAGGSSMVIISLLIDGGLDVDRLAEILDPRWGPPGWEWREYPIQKDWHNKPVFPGTTDGSPLKPSEVDAWLRKLSINCGFEHLINRRTCHDSVTHAVQAEKKSLFDPIATLARLPVIADGASSDLKCNTRPDRHAPKALTDSQIQEVEESLRPKVERCERTQALHGPENEGVILAREKLTKTQEKLLNLRLEQAREEFFLIRGISPQTSDQSTSQSSRDLTEPNEREEQNVLDEFYQRISKPHDEALNILKCLDTYQRHVQRELDGYRGSRAPQI